MGVLGLEKTGLSVIKAVQQAGGLLICWDDDKHKRDNLTVDGITVRDLNDKNIIRELDLLVVSPGIPHLYPEAHPIAVSYTHLTLPPNREV